MQGCGFRPAAAALIQPLAWEPPYAAGEALKREGGKKRRVPCFHGAVFLSGAGAQWITPEWGSGRGHPGKRGQGRSSLGTVFRKGKDTNTLGNCFPPATPHLLPSSITCPLFQRIYYSIFPMYFSFSFLSSFLSFFFPFSFLFRPVPMTYGSSQAWGQIKLQLLAYATVTAPPELSRVCGLH